MQDVWLSCARVAGSSDSHSLQQFLLESLWLEAMKMILDCRFCVVSRGRNHELVSFARNSDGEVVKDCSAE
eukprot:3963077-Amphidinium_carterae.1